MLVWGHFLEVIDSFLPFREPEHFHYSVTVKEEAELSRIILAPQSDHFCSLLQKQPLWHICPLVKNMLKPVADIILIWCLKWNRFPAIFVEMGKQKGENWCNGHSQVYPYKFWSLFSYNSSFSCLVLLQQSDFAKHITFVSKWYKTMQGKEPFSEQFQKKLSDSPTLCPPTLPQWLDWN